MKKIKIRYIVWLIILLLISWISFYFYTEMNGYPWKHAEVKTEAAAYMKQKYNMDVKVAGSSFNFKDDSYTAKVYNVKDDQNLIRVEKQSYYDEKIQGRGERMADNYSIVYWEKRINDELQETYPKFYKLDDIEKINTDIAFFTNLLENGVSSNKDENGNYIPLKPDQKTYILNVNLKTTDISDEFLKELLIVIRDMASKESKSDVNLTGKTKVSDNSNNTGKTTYLYL